MSAWLRTHVHALADALARISAQPLASAMSIFVLGIAIALPLLAAVALRSAGAVASSLDTEPHLNVFLALDATDDDVSASRRRFAQSPRPAKARFVSRTRPWRSFKSKDPISRSSSPR
jgi:cell division transport system permease protein